MAERRGQCLEIRGQRLHQPLPVGVVVDGQPPLVIVARAWDDERVHLVGAAQHSAAKPAARHSDGTCSLRRKAFAVSGAPVNSASRSASGGMRSSRSIIVGTGPKRSTAAA